VPYGICETDSIRYGGAHISLRFKNIYIGPSLPAFFSKTVSGKLMELFELHPITTPEQDLAKILRR